MEKHGQPGGDGKGGPDRSAQEQGALGADIELLGLKSHRNGQAAENYGRGGLDYIAEPAPRKEWSQQEGAQRVPRVFTDEVDQENADHYPDGYGDDGPDEIEIFKD